MFKILCKWGFHRPLKKQYCSFVDKVSGSEVWVSKCPCGKEWLTDSFFGWLGTKIERKMDVDLGVANEEKN